MQLQPAGGRMCVTIITWHLKDPECVAFATWPLVGVAKWESRAQLLNRKEPLAGDTKVSHMLMAMLLGLGCICNSHVYPIYVGVLL